MSPGADTPLIIDGHITDGRRVGDPATTITVDSWRGVQTVTVPLPRIRRKHGGWQITTASDPEAQGRSIASRPAAADPHHNASTVEVAVAGPTKSTGHRFAGQLRA